MAIISVSDADFSALFEAANDAKRTGNERQATALDHLARRVNAALGSASVPNVTGQRKGLTWKDVPSVLEDETEVLLHDWQPMPTESLIPHGLEPWRCRKCGLEVRSCTEPDRDGDGGCVR